MPKLLLIDDKQDNLITLSAILKNLMADCHVLTAQSGREGIEKAKAESPDTILLDIKMPEMDGYEVCNRLKEIEQTKHIPVIMISAIKTESEDLIKGLETGADAFLAKPIDEYLLIAQVKTALRIKRAEDKLRNQKDLLEEMVKERTRALRESEEKMRAILRASPIGIVLSINRTGNNINTNASAKLNTPNVSGWTGKSVASPANVMPASFMPCKMKKN